MYVFTKKRPCKKAKTMPHICDLNAIGWHTLPNMHVYYSSINAFIEEKVSTYLYLSCMQHILGLDHVQLVNCEYNLYQIYFERD